MSNQCSACRENFGSVAAFDAHRLGDYPQKGPADWFDRVRAGLVDGREEWRPGFGRRCLDIEELENNPRFTRTRHGWSLTSDIAGGRAMRGLSKGPGRGGSPKSPRTLPELAEAVPSELYSGEGHV